MGNQWKKLYNLGLKDVVELLESSNLKRWEYDVNKIELKTFQSSMEKIEVGNLNANIKLLLILEFGFQA